MPFERRCFAFLLNLKFALRLALFPLIAIALTVEHLKRILVSVHIRITPHNLIYRDWLLLFIFQSFGRL